MPKAEGRIFAFEDEKTIQTSFLEIFPYQGERQFIVYETKEFSCVCPFSGLPDFGRLVIEYIPAQFCLELKALKYYLTSYRQVGIYQEAVTNRLFSDIYQKVQPAYLKITTVYNTRGGIDAVCCIEKGKK